MFPFTRPQASPPPLPDDVELILEAVRSNFHKDFRGDDLLLLAPGSTVTKQRSSIFSDIDLLAVINKEEEIQLSLGTLEKLLLPIRQASIELREKEIYVGTFYYHLTESLSEGMVKYNMALIKKADPSAINVKLIQAMLYPNINSFLVNTAHYERQVLLEGKLLIGEKEPYDTISKLSDAAKDPEFVTKYKSRKNLLVEGNIRNSYILFKSNPNLPYEVLAKESIRSLKVALVQTGSQFLRKNFDINTFDFSRMLEEMDKFPASSEVAFKEMNEIREGNEVPGEERVNDLYKKCVDAINEISVMWL